MSFHLFYRESLERGLIDEGKSSCNLVIFFGVSSNYSINHWRQISLGLLLIPTISNQNFSILTPGYCIREAYKYLSFDLMSRAQYGRFIARAL